MFNGLKRGIVICACAALAVSCMDYGPIEKEDFEIDNAGSGDEVTGKGLFITNEGNFMYGNASLSYYDPEKKHVENEVFARANAIKLGDVAQSMVIRNGIGWIVVNNSGVIYAIDINTFKEVGRITGFTSPRYIHFLSDEKAYVTQIWDPRIYIVNPKTYQITGYVETDMDFETGSTEQMVQYDKYVFTNCWSYQNRILVIDTETDKVCDQITVGIQPTSLVMDKYNKIWTVTDGGYEGSPYGHEAPSLYCIDAATRKIEKQFKFKFGDWPSEVQLNGTRDTIYFINKAVWRLPVTADKFPVKPFLPYNNTLYYGLTINPVNSEVYIADAIDYVQNGVVLRYSPTANCSTNSMSGSSPAPSAGANHIIRIIIHEQNTDLFHIARSDGGRLQQGRAHHHRCRTGADHHVRHRPGRLSRQSRPGVHHYALLPVRRSGRLLMETGRNGQNHLDRTAAHLPVRLRQ